MENKDFFGVPLVEGDYVIAAHGINAEPNIALYKIAGFTNSSVKILRLSAKRPKPAYRRPNNVLKVDPAMLTFRGLVK